MICHCLADQLINNNNWSAHHWQITIFCSTSSNNCWIFVKRKNRGQICLFSQSETTILDLQNVQFEFRWVLRHYFLLWGHLRVTNTSKKVTMITSTHYLSLSSLRWKVLHFLLPRMNKLDRNFLNWQFFSFFGPLRNHVTLLLSHQSLRASVDGGYC